MYDEESDGSHMHMQGMALHIPDEKEMSTKMESEDVNAADEPGPSGLQQMHQLSVVGDDSLEVMLAEVEDNSLELNTSITDIDRDQPVNMDELNTLLAINEAFKETLENLIRRVALAVSKNRETHKLLKAKLRQTVERGLQINVKKVPISRFIFPYFRDSHEMEPPKNAEYELKVFRREYDPLVKEEKKWSMKECQILASAVRKSLIEVRIRSFVHRKEMIAEKISAAGQETPAEQVAEWKRTIAELDRLIVFHKSVPDDEILMNDCSEVDWAKIAKVDFLGNRTPKQVQLKWLNEQCPRWSKEAWSPYELERLRECAGEWNNWNVIAERLGTARTAFQCFVKFRSELDIDNTGRSWTKEEDAHLMTLTHCMQVNGKMPWEKIAHHMEERSRQQCTIRYRRALDTDIKFGRWDASEDVLLTCAVSRFGTKDWIKVASAVPGRSDSQCRDRWVNVLDKSIKAEPWSVNEDEKLLEGIRIFGKGEWSRISTMIPGRSASHCKSRFRSLLSAKVKLASECRTYPFRRFNWKGKHRRQEVETTFRKLLAADGQGSLAEQVMKTFDMRALSVDEMEALSAMAPEQRIVVMQFLNEVHEKHLRTSGEDEEAIWKLLRDKLQFDPSYFDSSSQTALVKYFKRFFVESVGEFMTCDEINEFETKYNVLQEIDPEAAKDHVINGLCDLIERNDDTEYCNYQERITKPQVVDQINQYICSVLINDVNKAISSRTESFPLPPCIGSVHLYENIQEDIHSLREVAARYFERITPDDDSLLIKISRQLRRDSEYILFKKKMRALLFWPMLLYRALETKESVDRRKRLRSIANEQLAEQQKHALENIVSMRFQGHSPPDSDVQILSALAMDDEEDDGCSTGLTVRDFLKQTMYTRPRRHYIAETKEHEENTEKCEEAKAAAPEVSEIIDRRIDECIESVCTAVQRIYERDFVIPAAYRAAVERLRGNSARPETKSERDAVKEVKEVLDKIIDEIANDKTGETSNNSPKGRRQRKKAVGNVDSEGGQTVLENQPGPSKTRTSGRKRKSQRSARSDEPFHEPKRVRRRVSKKLAGDEDLGKEAGRKSPENGSAAADPPSGSSPVQSADVLVFEEIADIE